MKIKYLLALTATVAAAGQGMAQSAVDAYNLTHTELRGTARFVGMGGAFTSLGGDLSTLGQNPAGIGIYRRNEIGATLDISIRGYKTTSQSTASDNETKCMFDNVGYIGSISLPGTMKNFNWGVSYSRLNSFDRMSQGYMHPTGTSLSNYIASYTNGVPSSDILLTENYNPYSQSGEDWLSILAYNSYMISNVGNDTQYAGLFQNGTDGDAEYATHEWGYTDEYNIDFGGNISDIVYWGIGVGIIDMQYSRQTVYNESMANAAVYDQSTDAITSGNAYFNLANEQYINGTGANLKLGLIVRPIDELRIGVAVHTPTWLHLTHGGIGDVTQYNYTPNGSNNTLSGDTYTDNFDFSSRLNTPWRFMIGASTVIGGRAILSADYERVAYNDMKMKEQNYGRFGSNFVDNEYANADIKDYFRAANIIRIGAEYRVTPGFSVRAGYNYQQSAVKQDAADGSMTIYTSGTNPSYTFNKDTQSISLGLGYRYKAWYIDATYQHVHQGATFHAYTNFDTSVAPTASVSNNFNNIIISTGLKF